MPKIKMMRKFRINVVNKKWLVVFRRPLRFAKEWGADTLAITVPNEKTIFFNLKETTFETIAHELTHAYLDELCLGASIGLKKRQLEEAFCELLSKHGYIILGQAKQILLAYEKIKANL